MKPELSSVTSLATKQKHQASLSISFGKVWGYQNPQIWGCIRTLNSNTLELNQDLHVIIRACKRIKTFLVLSICKPQPHNSNSPSFGSV